MPKERRSASRYTPPRTLPSSRNWLPPSWKTDDIRVLNSANLAYNTFGGNACAANDPGWPDFPLGDLASYLSPIPFPSAGVALAIGLTPGTALLNSVPGTLLYGFAIGFLGIWGIGGLLGFRRKPVMVKT